MISLSELFTNNYQCLNKVAARIDYNRAEELMSCTYLRIYESQAKYPKENEDFIKWFCTCMKNDFRWSKSDFNAVVNPKESVILDGYDSFIEDITESGYWSSASKIIRKHLVDHSALTEIELTAEDTNDFTKEIIDISSNLGKEKTLKYIETLEFKRTLSEPDKILFELYYEKDLSTRKIAELYSDSNYKMNYQSVNLMINNIKTKIKNHKWKQ